MARTNAATFVAVLGGLLVTACGTENAVELSGTQPVSEEAGLHGGLTNEDYYFLRYVGDKLLAQMAHARLGAKHGATADVRHHAFLLFNNSQLGLTAAQNLAQRKQVVLDSQLSLHQQYRVDKLGRHAGWFDFNLLYLNYEADNLVGVLDASDLAAHDAYDPEVRCLASALSNTLQADFQNAENLLHGLPPQWPANGGNGKDPGQGDDGKGPTQGEQGQGQGQQQTNCQSLGDLGPSKDPGKPGAPEKPDTDQGQGQVGKPF